MLRENLVILRIYRTKKAGIASDKKQLPLLNELFKRLLSQAELADDCAVSFNIAILEVVEQTTTFAYQHRK
jgi:hypothetical protein